MKCNRLLLSSFFAIALVVNGYAVEPTRLLEQLADPHTTSTAEQQLETLGNKDKNVSTLISEKLPSLIENAANLSVLYRMANLAGNLRVRSTVPALSKRLEQDNLVYMSQTFYQSAQLENDPVARALVAIGNDSINTLAKALRSPTSQIRFRAARALKLLATPAAETAITAYRKDGTDPRILGMFR